MITLGSTAVAAKSLHHQKVPCVVLPADGTKFPLFPSSGGPSLTSESNYLQYHNYIRRRRILQHIYPHPEYIRNV